MVRSASLLLLALLLALLAAWLADGWLQQQGEGGADSGVPVVVAALPVPFGKRIEVARTTAAGLRCGSGGGRYSAVKAASTLSAR